MRTTHHAESGGGGESAEEGILILDPDYNSDICVWEDGEGAVPLRYLADYGVSASLIARLEDWFEAWKIPGKALSDVGVGSPLTIRLARDLEREAPNYRVYLRNGADCRPYAEWAK